MSDCHSRLTAEAAEFVESQLAAGTYSSADEMVSTALEQLRERQAQQRLAELLMEGVNSNPKTPVTEEWWEKNAGCC